MLISELIQKLQAIADVHGDLPVSVIDSEGGAPNVDNRTADWSKMIYIRTSNRRNSYSLNMKNKLGYLFATLWVIVSFAFSACIIFTIIHFVNIYW
jgi:hypothetical protein